MTFIKTADSLKIYYQTSGSGIPIVFIHPPMMSQVVFKYQHNLSNQFQVITYDIRGHGNSSNNREDPTISRLAADLLHLLDILGIDKAVIAGYSAGGTIAQEFALTYPDRVKALVLSGGFSEVSTLSLKLHYHCGINLLQKGGEKLISHLLAQSHKANERDKQVLLYEGLKANPQTALNYYENSLEYNCTRQLKFIRCPVLLLYGQFSHIRSYLHIYERHIPQMKSILISQTFHQLPIKNHNTFNHACSTFLKGI